MNILQIKPLAKVYGCEITTRWESEGEQVIVSKDAQSIPIGSVLTVSAMTRDELQRIFESVSGVSLRDWWVGSEARR